MNETNMLSPSFANTGVPLHLFVPSGRVLEYRAVKWTDGKPVVSNPLSLEACPLPFPKSGENKTVLILPKRVVMTKSLVLASVNEEEISRIVEIRSLKLFPLGREERWIHFEVIEKNGDGYSSLMLYCVPKTKLAPWLAPLLEKGIVPDEMWVRPALFTRLLNSRFPSEEAFRFAYAGPQGVEVGIGKRDSLLFSRSLETGPEDSGEDIGRAVGDAWDLAERKLRLKPVRDCFWIGEDFSAPPPNSPRTQWVLVQVSWNECLSAWRNNPLPPFLIPTVEAHKKNQKKQLPLLRFLFLAVLMGILLVGGLKLENAALNRRHDDLSTSIRKIKGDAEWILTLKEQLEFATAHYSASEKFTVALQELCQLMPNGSTLTLFQTKGTKELLLKGVSKSGLLDTVEKLEKSPVFRNVSLKSQNKLAKEQGVEFHILCSLEGD